MLVKLIAFFSHRVFRFCLNFAFLCSGQSNVIIYVTFSSFTIPNSISPMSFCVFLELYFSFGIANQVIGFYRRRGSGVFIVEHIEHS